MSPLGPSRSRWARVPDRRSSCAATSPTSGLPCRCAGCCRSRRTRCTGSPGHRVCSGTARSTRTASASAGTPPGDPPPGALPQDRAGLGRPLPRRPDAGGSLRRAARGGTRHHGGLRPRRVRRRPLRRRPVAVQPQRRGLRLAGFGGRSRRATAPGGTAGAGGGALLLLRGSAGCA